MMPLRRAAYCDSSRGRTADKVVQALSAMVPKGRRCVVAHGASSVVYSAPCFTESFARGMELWIKWSKRLGKNLRAACWCAG